MFKIAFRNVLRNGRRSLMTASAVAVGAVALILAGEYFGMIRIGMETGVVQNTGHLAVFKQGYSDFGSARPGDYSISGYQTIVKLIREDAALKPMVNVVTPVISLGGIAGNAALDKSNTFYGAGFVPSDRDKMNRWDEYNLYRGNGLPKSGLHDGVLDHGVVGTGMARMLGLCEPLGLKDCPGQPRGRNDFGLDKPAGGKSPRLDLLSSAGGSPNIVAFYVDEAHSMGAKALDDMYVGMNLLLAQQLLYGGGEHKVSSVVIQLHRTEDVAAARARLATLFREHKLGLEIRDYSQLVPIVVQTLGFFYTLYAFMALILGIIVVFTVANTMGMSVMERTNEIGTARAMGLRRGSIRRQFLLEGAILGVFGATAGLVLARILSDWINRSGISYTPPGNSTPVPLQVLTVGNEGLLLYIWLSLVILAALASIVPANRAARMKVVDALRHV